MDCPGCGHSVEDPGAFDCPECGQAIRSVIGDESAAGLNYSLHTCVALFILVVVLAVVARFIQAKLSPTPYTDSDGMPLEEGK